MTLIQLREQFMSDTPLPQSDIDKILPFMEDKKEISFTVKRGRDKNANCLSLYCDNDEIRATDSYFVGLDWLHENEIAIQVNPKMNDNFEIDYIKMLNEALCEQNNFDHLSDLITIKFNKPSILIDQHQDLLSIFLLSEYISILYRIVRKGLKKSYYTLDANLSNKIKGRILSGKNIHSNLSKGKIINNYCRYHVYDIDSKENRILKKALYFCDQRLSLYGHTFDSKSLQNKIRFIKPYFTNVKKDISIKDIKTIQKNPVFKEYNLAIEFAQLILRRFSYNISKYGNKAIPTPPFWIDMSKLFELYVFQKLKQVFPIKNEITYHVKAHYQELDYLANPGGWSNPYIIDAKYKPRYKNQGGITLDDAREVSGYARLSDIYHKLGLDENNAPPIKCLIIYPDQDADENFNFTRFSEPLFPKITGYIRFYKIGIRLPVIQSEHQ